MLDINGRLDFDTILEMYKRGHTRIPVCDGDPQNPQVPIVGLVLTKDLMLVDPDDQLETRTFLHYCGRPIRAVSEDLPLNEMLEMVIAGPEGKGNQTHMFFVQHQLMIVSRHFYVMPAKDGLPLNMVCCHDRHMLGLTVKLHEASRGGEHLKSSV